MFFTSGTGSSSQYLWCQSAHIPILIIRIKITYLLPHVKYLGPEIGVPDLRHEVHVLVQNLSDSIIILIVRFVKSST
jgi:hypothetical protein